jgi:hypothetical protein
MFCAAHNLKVVGSNPTPATNKINGLAKRLSHFFVPTCILLAFSVQKPRAASESEGRFLVQTMR